MKVNDKMKISDHEVIIFGIISIMKNLRRTFCDNAAMIKAGMIDITFI